MGSPVTLLDHGFFRARAVTPVLSLAQPRDNAQALTAAARAAEEAEVALLLTPELSLTGYSCEDLFLTEPLLEESREALAQLLRDTAELPLSLVVGAPWPVADGRVFNVALVLSAGQVVGAVPKGALPTYGEFYEQRWFDSGEGVALTVEDPRFGTFPLAQQLGFETLGVRWALELCEDRGLDVDAPCERLVVDGRRSGHRLRREDESPQDEEMQERRAEERAH